MVTVNLQWCKIAMLFEVNGNVIKQMELSLVLTGKPIIQDDTKNGKILDRVFMIHLVSQ